MLQYPPVKSQTTKRNADEERFHLSSNLQTVDSLRFVIRIDVCSKNQLKDKEKDSDPSTSNYLTLTRTNLASLATFSECRLQRQRRKRQKCLLSQQLISSLITQRSHPPTKNTTNQLSIHRLFSEAQGQGPKNVKRQDTCQTIGVKFKQCQMY